MKVHMKGNLVIVGKSAQSFWLDITAINLSWKTLFCSILFHFCTRYRIIPNQTATISTTDVNKKGDIVENKRSSLELVDLLECEALMFFKLLGMLQENWLIFYGCNLLDFLFL